jgi:hypothetical protein
MPTRGNPKHEIRNPKPIQMSKSQFQNGLPAVSIIWISDFEFVSNFGFRISSLSCLALLFHPHIFFVQPQPHAIQRGPNCRVLALEFRRHLGKRFLLQHRQ